MAEAALKLKVVTPIGVAVECEVTSITAPGFDGEVGMLPLHAKYSAIGGIGVVRFVDSAGKSGVGVVNGGFISVVGDTVTILTDSFDSSDVAKAGGYDSERQTLATTMAPLDTRSAEWQRARQKLERIEAIDSLKGA